MTAQQQKILFFSGAWFNWIVGGGLLFFYPLVYRLLGIEQIPSEPLFIHLFSAIVVIFGYGYYLAGKDPAAHRGIVLMGMLAKLAVVIVVYGHWLQGGAPWQLAVIATVDLVYAVLFGRFLMVPLYKTQAV